MSKVVLIGIIIPLLQSKPVIQTISLTVVNVVFFYLLIKQRPFVSRVINILTIAAGNPNKNNPNRILLDPEHNLLRRFCP